MFAHVTVDEYLTTMSKSRAAWNSQCRLIEDSVARVPELGGQL